MASVDALKIQCYICDAVFEDNDKLWHHINEENCEKEMTHNVLGHIGDNIGEQKANSVHQTDNMVKPFSDSIISSPLIDQSTIGDENKQPSPSPSTTSSKANNSYFCKVCMIPLVSLASFKSHISGKKHLKSLKRCHTGESPISTPSKTDAISAPPTSSTIPTTLVNVVAPVSESQPVCQPTASVSTSESRQSNSANRLIKKAEPSTDTWAPKRAFLMLKSESYFCEPCGISVSSKAIFDSHLSGKRHALMLEKQKYRGLQTAAGVKLQPKAPAQLKPSTSSAVYSHNSTVCKAKSEGPSVSSATPPARASGSVDNANADGRPCISLESDLRPVLRQLCLTQIVTHLCKVSPSCPGLSQLVQSTSLNNTGSQTEKLLATVVQAISQGMCNSTGMSSTAQNGEQSSSPTTSSSAVNPYSTPGGDLLHSLMLLCWCQQLHLLLPEQEKQREEGGTSSCGNDS